MLGELEDLIEARLKELAGPLRNLTVESYGGELSDPDLLSGLLKRCPAVLVMVPKATFKKRSQERYNVPITFRLVIATRHPRGERETRRGYGQKDIGSYELWEACMHQLTDWQPWPDRAAITPTELSNLVNGKLSSDHLSVLGQSFVIELDWVKPKQALPDFLGIDMEYHAPSGIPEPVATDTIELRDV
ncbi:Mu-like prophage protein gp37 [Pseudomonas asplenii]|uniref:Mu-like prophage protein gp37 n=1 Tax=Pseudomonas asplenii TaxID=53407 RepID=A0A0M9GGG8_9PSED|nr:phage protein Gp37 [Pseudomonas fuscovaginae]KPA90608.1 Mu-like prophage protein gp37 [Pseudomonas fuscovaginae]